MDPFSIIDVTSWPKDYDEPRGIREKVWLRSPYDTGWLRKRPRAGRPYEPAVEIIALRLAARCGVPAAKAEAAVWNLGDEVVRGIVVENFVASGTESQPGSAILARADQTYDVGQKELHTVDRVFNALGEFDVGTNQPSLEFLRMLLFDSWVGNSDRHPENWSMLSEGTGVMRLAPMYDPAACLGVELLDDHKLLNSPTASELSTYAGRCPSGFGDGVKLVPLASVIDSVSKRSEWDTERDDFCEKASNAFDELPDFLETIPLDWFPEKRRDFVRAILEVRLDMLQELR